MPPRRWLLAGALAAGLVSLLLLDGSAAAGSVDCESRLPQEAPPAGTHYVVLGVPTSFSDGTLKKAYRKLAKVWHPDRMQGLCLGTTL